MSFMQVCWSLMRYPRSKGIPYIMENGTFDQALVFMLRLFGIMLGLWWWKMVSYFLSRLRPC